MKAIQLNKSEIQSKLDRVVYAENLILQLPKDHDGRNTWLLNYGTSEEANGLREQRNIRFDEVTQSAYSTQQTEDDQPIISLTKEEFDKLDSDSDFLRRLEAAGVDNWDGYEVAREI